MTIWAGVIDVWAGRIIATTTSRSQKLGSGARKLASALNRLNAGPDYKGLGGFVNGKTYYRFQAFEFNKFSFRSADYLKYLSGNVKTEFINLVQKARTVLQREAKEARENYEKAELAKIEAFDIPEEYKAIIRDELFKEY